jgi:intracellular septation protein
MNNQNASKSFFFLSFLPALAYWYLEEYYPVKIAVTGGLILAILEIALEKIFTKHVHTLSKFNFLLLLVLGGMSLQGENGIWFKLQPFFTGLIMGGFLLYKLKTGEGLFLEMTKTMHPDKIPPKEILTRLERDLSLFLIIYGCGMGYLAVFGTTSQWAFFKTIGFYIAFALFFIIEMILIRRKKIE